MALGGHACTGVEVTLGSRGHAGREGREGGSRWAMGRIRGQMIKYLDALFSSLPSNVIIRKRKENVGIVELNIVSSK